MISYQDCDPILSWEGLVEAIQLGHKRNKAEISDTFLYRKDDTLLSRSAWIDGIGIAIKCATIFPGNKDFQITYAKKGEFNQVLLGVTGSGKTFTMAKVIEETNRPALILAPNKKLCIWK